MPKRKILFFSVILCVLFICTGAPAGVSAAGLIDTEERCELMLEFTPDKSPAEGASFRLYRVASVSAACEFTVTEGFQQYPVEIQEEPEEDSWRILASTLSNYAADGSVKPDYAKRTDENGIAVFSDLPTGLYLVCGDAFQAERRIYTPQSFMICLPGLSEEDVWTYEATTEIKYDDRSDSEDTDIEVLKVWSDNNAASCPDEIEVELYDGSELYDTVTLSKENNWQYKWTELYGKTTWSVKEKNEPDGYTVTVERQGSRFVVTNKKVDSGTGNDSPGTSTDSNGTSTDSNGTPTDTSGTSTDSTLPQTGMLWWPVPLLTCAGLFLFMAGWIKYRQGGKKDE